MKEKLTKIKQNEPQNIDKNSLLEGLQANPLILPLLFWEGTRMQNKGQMPQEKNYFNSLCLTFIKYLSMDSPLSLDLIKQIHLLCTDKVTITEYYLEEETDNPICAEQAEFFKANSDTPVNSFHTKIKKDELDHHLDFQNYIDAFEEKHPELVALKPPENRSPFSDKFVNIGYYGPGIFLDQPLTAENIQEFKNLAENPVEGRVPFKSYSIGYLNHETIEYRNEFVSCTLEEYYQTMEVALNDRDKIKAIVDCFQKLVRFHPFSDANCRLFCMELLNLELVKYGLMPTIQTNPNYFANLSVNALTDYVIEGQYRFKQCLEHNPTLTNSHIPPLTFEDEEKKVHTIGPTWIENLEQITNNQTWKEILDQKIEIELTEKNSSFLP